MDDDEWIIRWWEDPYRSRYLPAASRLLVTAPEGGPPEPAGPTPPAGFVALDDAGTGPS